MNNHFAAVLAAIMHTCLSFLRSYASYVSCVTHTHTYPVRRTRSKYVYRFVLFLLRHYLIAIPIRLYTPMTFTSIPFCRRACVNVRQHPYLPCRVHAMSEVGGAQMPSLSSALSLVRAHERALRNAECTIANGHRTMGKRTNEMNRSQRTLFCFGVDRWQNVRR